jgi:uncharacterized Zn finger protein
MPWYEWEGYDSMPRRPANGIKAQTQTGKFGKTWWASRWLAALERLIDATRLSRGRSYARSGQVVKLEIGRDGVEARVQGSRVTPYKLNIKFRPLSDAEWEKVTDAIAAQALYAAKLLAGEMPEQIQEVFEAAGASLFPTKGNDLETDCTCPDWANPCKHVAAVYYLLGERFDADPFLIFEMRGRSKDDIIADLRTRRMVELALDTPEGEEQVADEAETVLPLEQSLDTFWSVPEAALTMPMDFTPPAVHGLPIKRLGPPPFWPSKAEFTELMEQAYEEIAARALRMVMGEE